MKSSNEMLQNLPYFWHKKTHVVFFIFQFMLLYFFLNECPGLCRHRHRLFAKIWIIWKISLSFLLLSLSHSFVIFTNMSTNSTTTTTMDTLIYTPPWNLNFSLFEFYWHISYFWVALDSLIWKKVQKVAWQIMPLLKNFTKN